MSKAKSSRRVSYPTKDTHATATGETVVSFLNIGNTTKVNDKCSKLNAQRHVCRSVVVRRV